MRFRYGDGVMIFCPTRLYIIGDLVSGYKYNYSNINHRGTSYANKYNIIIWLVYLYIVGRYKVYYYNL